MRHVTSLRLLAAMAAAGLLISCDRTSDRGELVSWRDGDTRIWLVDDGSFDLTLQLHVERAGRRRFEYVIDKSTYSTLRLIKYRGQLLAVNDRFIFAAYDTASDSIIRYDALPFTIWEGQGEIVSSHRWSDGPASMRAGFPMWREGGSAG